MFKPYTSFHQHLARISTRTFSARPCSTRFMATSAASQSSSSESCHPPRPRRFVPLKPGATADSSLPKLKGIIFDVDGTLCLPQNYMFREMRSALGIDRSVDILDHIHSLSDTPDHQSDSHSSPQFRAKRTIEDIERTAMSAQKPQPGLLELMTYLESRHIPKALCTRNFPAPVDHLIETFLGDLNDGFDMIITRDTKGIKPKPSPEGLWKIAEHWGLATGVQSKDDDPLEVARRVLGKGMIMVGDSIDDMAAGHRAGAATVLLVNEENEKLTSHEYTDLSVRRLDDLIKVLEEGFVGRT